MNIFDGNNGNTNGKTNGTSAELTGDGNLVNIFVAGDFDGASVEIQKYVYASNSFASTAAVFTEADVFQGLMIRPSDRFRLRIVGAGSGTHLYAEVN